MSVKFHRIAEGHLLDIWDYTESKWGADQADAYLTELIKIANGLGSQRYSWKQVPEESLSGVFCIRHRHHVLFFRELPEASIGIIAVLHERMDLPARLLNLLRDGITF